MKNKYIVWIKVALHLACLIPLARLGYLYDTDDLGANPLEFITHSTGTWTLVFLLVTLGVTPLRQIIHQQWLGRLRRMIGLYAFFYACLHFTTYAYLDRYLEWAALVGAGEGAPPAANFFSFVLQDVAKRPFVTAGFTSFVLLIPLAATSNKWMLKLLTGRRWQQLHRLIYLSAMAGVVHFLWLVKADRTQPYIYGSILLFLLGYRATVKLLSWRPARRSRSSSSPLEAEQVES
jgi:sulfoxide reductase heme-binding subunit YedZ